MLTAEPAGDSRTVPWDVTALYGPRAPIGSAAVRIARSAAAGDRGDERETTDGVHDGVGKLLASPARPGNGDRRDGGTVTGSATRLCPR